MDRALANALRKMAYLEQKFADVERELAEVKQFIELHNKYLNETVSEHSERDSGPALPELDRARGAPNNLEPLAKRASPIEIAGAAERVIRDVGHPLSRSDLVRELEDRDFHIPSEDKVNYIGTILWRHAKDRLVNLGGKGYWIADLPNIQVGYNPNAILTDMQKDYTVQQVLLQTSKETLNQIVREYERSQTIPRDLDRILLRHCADTLGRPLKADELRQMRRLLAEAASSKLQRDGVFD